MIETKAIPRNELPLFSPEELDLIYNQIELKDFIGIPFSAANIKKQIELKKESFNESKRINLAHTLEENYNGIDHKNEVLKNIKLLKEKNTYTITTGHQVCLYGGPLYFFIKILHVIKLCNTLKEQYPKYHFVPVFWMASEDHDSLEIESLKLFNKTLTWKHEQTGAVGHFNTKNLSVVKDELSELFNEKSELHAYLNALQGGNYGVAFRNWLHHVFGNKGLIVLDANQVILKSEMKPYFSKELKEEFSNQCIEETNTKLRSINRRPQIHSRPINLFYMDEGSRTRITKEGELFKLGQETLNEDKILKLVNSNPERFSPNVALRPLYQEVILPNLCYIGGMAELKYWTQLKNIFTSCAIPYPMLKMRANVLWIDKVSSKLMRQLNLTPNELFESNVTLEKKAVKKEDPNPINKNALDKHLHAIQQIYTDAIRKDEGMRPRVEAELKKIDHLYKGLESKIEKSKKNSFEGQLKKIGKLKERLFPGQKLQERSVNLLHFCNQAGPKERIEDLYNAIDPLSTDFTILIENETE